MTTRALPIFCIMFLLFTSSLILRSTEAVRTLKDTTAQINLDATAYNPGNPSAPKGPRGKPYTRPCTYCPPPPRAKP